MKNYIYFVLLTLILGSCTDVIDVDVEDGGKRLVIEASILWEKGTSGQEQLIKLSESTTYFANEQSIPVEGATVKVKNEDSGEVYEFTDLGGGDYYINNFVPVAYNNYSLDVSYNDKSYSAEEQLIPVPDFTKIEQSTDDGFSDEWIEITSYFIDPEDEENYYLASFDISSKPLLDLRAFNDEFTNGNERFIRIEDEDLEAGDTVTTVLQGVTKRYHNFMDILIEQSLDGGGGGPFQTPPVQLKGNCINPNDANEEVLGYFRLSQYVESSVIVE